MCRFSVCRASHFATTYSRVVVHMVRLAYHPSDELMEIIACSDCQIDRLYHVKHRTSAALPRDLVLKYNT